MILDIGSGGRPCDRPVAHADVRIDVECLRNLTAVMDAHFLGFKSEAFDEVRMHEVLEHVDSPVRATKEARRVLRDRGKLIVTVPNLWEWRRVVVSIRNPVSLRTDFPWTTKQGSHKQGWDVQEFHSLAYCTGFTVTRVEWTDWYPKRAVIHRLDPLLKRAVPKALYSSHMLVELMKDEAKNLLVNESSKQEDASGLGNARGPRSSAQTRKGT